MSSPTNKPQAHLALQLRYRLSASLQSTGIGRYCTCPTPESTVASISTVAVPKARANVLRFKAIACRFRKVRSFRTDPSARPKKLQSCPCLPSTPNQNACARSCSLSENSDLSPLEGLIGQLGPQFMCLPGLLHLAAHLQRARKHAIRNAHPD